MRRIVLDLAETVERSSTSSPSWRPTTTSSVDQSPGLPVNGSRQAVERVLMNLVGNAAKYSDAGSTIRVLVRGADGACRARRRGRRAGHPRRRAGQIFAPFYRGQRSEVIRTRGAGLGLAIAAEFAASMGGEIRVERGRERRSQFRRFLPDRRVTTPLPTLELPMFKRDRLLPAAALIAVLTVAAVVVVCSTRRAPTALGRWRTSRSRR